jgi:hypothetical protein
MNFRVGDRVKIKKLLELTKAVNSKNSIQIAEARMLDYAGKVLLITHKSYCNTCGCEHFSLENTHAMLWNIDMFETNTINQLEFNF